MTTLDLLTAVDGAEESEGNTIRRAVNAARVHLGMEVAYVSEFVDGQSVFREVDAPGPETPIQVGDSCSLDDVYCRHILEGRLPELIPDTSREPLAASLAITQSAPIGCHLSVPILLPDGTPYGMFCCLSTTPEPSLNERDLRVMRAFADLAAHEIAEEEFANRHAQQKRDRILSVIGSQAFSQVYQPIWNLATQSVSGFECLTRFATEPVRTPDQWFAEAAHAGLGAELEIAAIAAALGPSRMLRENGYVTFNASPAAILSDGFFDVFADIDTSRVILEVTEHARVEDYDDLLKALVPYRA